MISVINLLNIKYIFFLGGFLIVQSKTIIYYDGNFRPRQIDLEFPTAARG